MGRPLRMLRGGAVYFGTLRCVERMFLLRPSPALKAQILWIVTQALASYPGLELFAWCTLSNHFHVLLRAEDPNDIAKFFRDVDGQLSRFLNLTHDRSGTSWEDRIHLEEIPEPDKQWDKLLYILMNAVEADLQPTPRGWDAIAFTTLPENLGYRPRRIWAKPTAEERRRAKGDQALLEPRWKELRVAQLPHLQSLSRPEHRSLLQRAIDERVREAAETRRRQGRRCWTKKALQAVDPFSSPNTPAKKERRPLVLTDDPAVRERFLREYRAFCDAYREASARYRAGEFDVPFPPNAFRPPVPILHSVPLAA